MMAYNEAANLPLLLERCKDVAAREGIEVVLAERGARVLPAFSPAVSLTAFVVNGWDVAVDNNTSKTVGGQIMLAPVSGLSLYAGACVGGSTVINDALCFRTPPEVLERWRSERVQQRLVGPHVGREQALPLFDERAVDARDQGADLLRLGVVGVVEPGREHIGADQDAALDLCPEAGGAGRGVHVLQVGALGQIAQEALRIGRAGRFPDRLVAGAGAAGQIVWTTLLQSRSPHPWSRNASPLTS